MFELIVGNKLALAMLVLPLTIIANNLFGAALASLEHQYDFKTLIDGVKKGALVYSGIIIYAFISLLMSDLTVQIGSSSYSLIDAMYIIVLAAVVNYSKKGVDKLIEITKYEVKDGGDLND